MFIKALYITGDVPGADALYLPSATQSLLGFALVFVHSFIPSNSPVLRGFSGPDLVQMKKNGRHFDIHVIYLGESDRGKHRGQQGAEQKPLT